MANGEKAVSGPSADKAVRGPDLDKSHPRGSGWRRILAAIDDEATRTEVDALSQSDEAQALDRAALVIARQRGVPEATAGGARTRMERYLSDDAARELLNDLQPSEEE